MIKYVTSSTLKRFDDAEKAYWCSKSDPDNRKEAALNMRNLLDGLKGDLFQLARSHNKENMTWEKMIKRLGIGVNNGDEHRALSNQKDVRGTLISYLTDIIKGRDPRTNLDHLRTQVLDHIYIVLGLLK